MDTNLIDCRRCQRRMVATKTWTRATEVERTIWRAAGLRQHKGRRLCGSCYAYAAKHDQLADYDRSTRSAEEVLGEWRHLADDVAGASRAEKIRRVAPRLGMSEDALEKALDRASLELDEGAAA